MWQHTFRLSVLSFCCTQKRWIVHNNSCINLNINLLHWIWGSMTNVSSLYICIIIQIHGEAEWVEEQAAEVVCNAVLALFKPSTVKAVFCGGGCAAATSVALDRLVAGGAVAALLMAGPCLLLEHAFLLINKHDLLTVEVEAKPWMLIPLPFWYFWVSFTNIFTISECSWWVIFSFSRQSGLSHAVACWTR